MVTFFKSRKGQPIRLSDDFNKIADCLNDEILFFIRDHGKFCGEGNTFDGEEPTSLIEWGMSVVTIGCDHLFGYRAEKFCIERDIVHVAYDTLIMLRDYISDSNVLEANIDVEESIYPILKRNHVHFPDDDVNSKRDIMLCEMEFFGIDCFQMIELCVLVRNKIALYKRYINANHV